MPTYKIIKIERKKTSSGKELAKVNLRDAVESTETEDVTIWGDFPNFQALDEGHTVEGDVVVKTNGNFTNKSLYKPVVAPKWATGGNKSGIKAAQERKEVMIEKAQARKSESIAYFNAVNSAIALVSGFLKSGSQEFERENMKAAIIYWRDWFLAEWAKYDSLSEDHKNPPF